MLFDKSKVPPRLSSAPKAPEGIIKLLATSGKTPAYWDDEKKLGLFTSRFLMGVAGIPAGGTESSMSWATLKDYVGREVHRAARTMNDADQTPEIDDASIELPVMPVDAVKDAVAAARDMETWNKIEKTNTPDAYRRYINECETPCSHKTDAQKHLDDNLWTTLAHSASYLTECVKQETGCFHKNEVSAPSALEQSPDRCPSLFEFAKSINTAAGYQQFGAECPNDPAAVMAKRAIEALQGPAPSLSTTAQPTASDRCPGLFLFAKSINTVAGYSEFVTVCPNDQAAVMAKRAIEALQGPAPSPNTPSQPPQVAYAAPVIETVPITPAPKVHLFRNTDFYGHDIGGQPGWRKGVATSEDCEQICVSNTSCAGFTYNINRSTCILKDLIDATRLYDPGEPTVMGIVEGRNPVSPRGKPSIHRFPNADYYGHDIGGPPGWIRHIKSAEVCETICVSRQECAGYTYNIGRSTCILKDFVDRGRLYVPHEETVLGIIDGRN